MVARNPKMKTENCICNHVTDKQFDLNYERSNIATIQNVGAKKVKLSLFKIKTFLIKRFPLHSNVIQVNDVKNISQQLPMRLNIAIFTTKFKHRKM